MKKGKKFRRMDHMIKKAENIFIMGHKDLDLDAIGSAIGMYEAANYFKKETFIIMDDEKHEAGVAKILELVEGKIKFITSKEAAKHITSKSLLIIVDVNKPAIMQDAEIANKFSKVVILDHHEKNETSIKAKFEIIDTKTSSTCETVAEYFYYNSYPFTPMCATFLLAGITLDTTDFSSKTSAKTHLAASYLIDKGASVKDVNNLLKQNLEEYILRQKVITDLEVINGNIAFSKGNKKIIYKREELAKIADTLLEFNHMEVSCVIGKLSDNEIGISARSIGNVNIGEVLSLLGGGGDRHDAACRIENKSLKEVETQLKKVLGELQ